MHQMVNKIKRLLFFYHNLGAYGLISYVFQKYRMNFMVDRAFVRLRSKYAKYPLICRANTTDIRVFKEIFVEKEYSFLDEIADIDLIVDCGANVGYSSAYFLSRFPHSLLAAIEPDKENYEVLERNLLPYNNRAMLIRGAIWPYKTILKISSENYRDGGEWSRQVTEAINNDSNQDDIPAYTIDDILKKCGADRISILKIDIEGSEVQLFSGDCHDWLSNVDHLIIELHDDSNFGCASTVFHESIQGLKFTISKHGVLTYCKRHR